MNESMMKMILKTLNIDPEKFKTSITTVMTAAQESEARLKRIEQKLDVIIRHMDLESAVIGASLAQLPESSNHVAT